MEIEVAWQDYVPPHAMQRAMRTFNELTIDEIRERLPNPKLHSGEQSRFHYRVFGEDPSNAEHIYVVLGGFAERPDNVDTGMKGLLTAMLAREVDARRTAVVSVGGLYSFSSNKRRGHVWRGSSALLAAAEEVATLVGDLAPVGATVTVSGFSMGGVLAPLVARAIVEQGRLVVERVHAAEPFYAPQVTSIRGILGQFSKSSKYRNEQILASGLATYISAKTTPGSLLQTMWYRAKIYRPLAYHLLSMRLVVRDMAKQAEVHAPQQAPLQFTHALQGLAERGISISVLAAENSVICRGESLERLIGKLRQVTDARLTVVYVRGEQADHGIEEHRSLSTPFLVMPQLYSAR